MSNDNNDISSTEKLLKVIRKRDAGDAAQFEDFSQPGFFEKIKRQWISQRPGDVIGVEITRDTIKLVRTAKGKPGMEVVYAASEPIPGGMNIEHPEFPDFLKQQLVKSGAISKKTDIWASLPLSKGEIWSLRVPKIRKGLANAVYWSARKEKTFDESNTVFDYRITGETLDNDTRKLAVDFCTAPADDVALYKKVFSGIGYPLTGITLPAFALNNLFYNRIVTPPGQKTYAVLCIGEESSSINIYGKENKIFFSRVIRTGRDSLVDSVIMAHDQQYENQGDPPPGGSEIGLEGSGDGGGSGKPEQALSSLSRQEALRLLKSSGDKSPESPGVFSSGQVFPMIEPALERLARQLERTIHHAGTILKNPSPGRIYICGSVSFLPGIADFFSEQLDIPAEVLDVIDPETAHVSNSLLFTDIEDRFSLVSTSGLAMPSGETINFLHTAFDKGREKLAMRSTNAVAAGCAMLFVLTAGYWWYALHEQDQARMAVAGLEQRLSEYSPRLDMDMITQMAQKHREMQKELVDYSRKLHAVGVINEIQGLTPEHIRMRNITVDMSRPEAGARADREPSLILEGFILEDAFGFEAEMAGYIRQLRRSPLVREVTVRRGTRDFIVADEAVYRFIINIDLEQV